MAVKDAYQRPLRNLRISVTDRCNLRCSYCMPEEDYVWLPREQILNFEEMSTLVDVFIGLGVDKIRLTGGEPLLRRDLPGELEQRGRGQREGRSRPHQPGRLPQLPAAAALRALRRPARLPGPAAL